MASVVFTYDGVATATATISSAIIGDSYSFSCFDPDSHTVSDIATSATLVLTINDIGGGFDPEKFVLRVGHDTDNTFVDATLIRFGHSGIHAQVATVSYDGVNTVTFTYPTDSGLDYFPQAWNPATGFVGDTWAGDGTTQTNNLDISGVGASPGDIIFINLETDTDAWGNWSDGVGLVIVYGTPFSETGTLDWYEGVSPPIPPANDDFANATIISGPSGSASSVNTVLATKETGEPNVFGGHQATVWWKWTAPADGWIVFEAVVPTPVDIHGSSGIWIYTGSVVSSLTKKASSNDTYNSSTPNQDHIFAFLYATSGVDYYIQYSDADAVGEVTLSWLPLTDPTPTMEFIESIADPFKVYPGGVIAVRAADFVSNARTGLSVISDSTTNIGTAVQEEQQITFVGLGGSPPNSNNASNTIMFRNADPTIEIPWDSITFEDGQNYNVYIRYKLTGGRASSKKFLSGLYTASKDTFVDLIPSTEDASTFTQNPFDQSKETPFWQYMQCRNWSGEAASGESIIIKALTADDNDAVWLIDQIVLVPIGTSSIETDELSVWWGGSGEPPSVPSGFSDDPRAGDFDDWVGGKFSVVEAGTADVSLEANGDLISEFQKKSSAASAEFTAGGIGKLQWDGYTDFILTGVGIVGLPDYSHFFHDDFNRTELSDWGIKDDWAWKMLIGISSSVAPGVAQIGTDPSSHAFIIFGATDASLTTRSRDFEPSFGLKIEATIGWDTGVPDGSYVGCIGELGSSGVSGNDDDFFGFAVVLDSGTWYGVIIQFNQNTSLIDAGVRELSSRVALSGTQPLDVVVTRKGQYIEAVVEGNTLTAYKSAIKFGGGFPYPDRAWEDYPYPTDLSVDPTYQFYGVDPKDSGSPCIAHFNLGNTGSPNYFTYVYDYKLSLLQGGTQPTTGTLRIENQDNSALFNEITLHDNAFQMISFPTGVYGGDYADSNLIDGHYDFGFFALKAWLPVGSAELSRIEFYETWFRQHFGPIGSAASIFWFYKDGQWRNQGVDPNYAIHFNEGGSWKKDTSLKGQLEGMWQP